MRLCAVFAILALVAMVVAVPNAAFAARIRDLFGETVTMSGLGDDAAAGDRYYALDAQNKRRAIIEVTSVGSEADAKLAYGKIVAGRPAVGHRLEKRTAETARAARRTRSGRALASFDGTRGRWRAGGGFTYFTIAGASVSSPSYDVGLAAIGYYALLDAPVMIDVGATIYQAGAKWSQRVSIGTTTASADVAVALNYLGAPVLAKWNLIADDSMFLRAKAGAMASYLLSSSARSTGAVAASVSDLMSTSLDFLALGGMEWISKPGGWWAEAMICYGLLPQSGKAGGSFVNQGLMITGGATF